VGCALRCPSVSSDSFAPRDLEADTYWSFVLGYIGSCVLRSPRACDGRSSGRFLLGQRARHLKSGLPSCRSRGGSLRVCQVYQSQ
jgi:hypothetical protein